jgi:PAS domain S-box-containing protein
MATEDSPLQDAQRRADKISELEQALRASEKRYRDLFEKSLDGIYKSTPQGKFVEVNPALVTMLGYDSEEDLKAIDIKTELYFKEEDRKLMSAHEEDQYPLRKKDGSKIWVEDHSHYDFDKQGNIIFHRGILRDVTGKVEKQTELAHLLAVTEDQNERLRNFAHIVSHNIRSHSSNLSSLIHFMEVMESPEERANLFAMLKKSVNKLEETIQNLNEIITVNQNLKKPAEPRHLKTEVNNTIEVLSGEIRRTNLAVSVDISEEIQVKVIPAYLDSILLNLISNAIKYQSPNVTSTLHISAKTEVDYTVLSIKDNGIGIDLNKNAAKLFGMYETFHGNDDARGFGLYITKNQIEAMGGKIDVESEPNVGSTFRVCFLNSTRNQ